MSFPFGAEDIYSRDLPPPKRRGVLPKRIDVLPQQLDVLPQRRNVLPQRGWSALPEGTRSYNADMSHTRDGSVLAATAAGEGRGLLLVPTPLRGGRGGAEGGNGGGAAAAAGSRGGGAGGNVQPLLCTHLMEVSLMEWATGVTRGDQTLHHCATTIFSAPDGDGGRSRSRRRLPGVCVCVASDSWPATRSSRLCIYLPHSPLMLVMTCPHSLSSIPTVPDGQVGKLPQHKQVGAQRRGDECVPGERERHRSSCQYIVGTNTM